MAHHRVGLDRRSAGLRRARLGAGPPSGWAGSTAGDPAPTAEPAGIAGGSAGPPAAGPVSADPFSAGGLAPYPPGSGRLARPGRAARPSHGFPGDHCRNSAGVATVCARARGRSPLSPTAISD